VLPITGLNTFLIGCSDQIFQLKQKEMEPAIRQIPHLCLIVGDSKLQTKTIQGLKQLLILPLTNKPEAVCVEDEEDVS